MIYEIKDRKSDVNNVLAAMRAALLAREKLIDKLITEEVKRERGIELEKRVQRGIIDELGKLRNRVSALEDRLSRRNRPACVRTDWTKIGELKAGRGVYRSLTGELAVERDHLYLVMPSTEEAAEIEEHLRKSEEEKMKREKYILTDGWSVLWSTGKKDGKKNDI